MAKSKVKRRHAKMYRTQRTKGLHSQKSPSENDNSMSSSNLSTDWIAPDDTQQRVDQSEEPLILSAVDKSWVCRKAISLCGARNDFAEPNCKNCGAIKPTVGKDALLELQMEL